jgi:chromosome segregation ATPase
MSAELTVALVMSAASLLTTLGMLVKASLDVRASKHKIRAEAEASVADADESRASAVEKYDQTVARMVIRQGNQEKRIDELKETIRCNQETANARIVQLEQEVWDTREENRMLRDEVENLKGDAVNYKTAISSLLHENGALKEWAERLVRQITALGAVPDPFVKGVKK